MGSSRRPRSERRAEGRKLAKNVRDRARLARLEEGGSPERPISLVSASLVEPKARAIPCPLCAGETRIDEHAAGAIGGKMLRLAHVSCPRCGHRRILYFTLNPALPN
jgi:hypothetical protein